MVASLEDVFRTLDCKLGSSIKMTKLAVLPNFYFYFSSSPRLVKHLGNVISERPEEFRLIISWGLQSQITLARAESKFVIHLFRAGESPF